MYINSMDEGYVLYLFSVTFYLPHVPLDLNQFQDSRHGLTSLLEWYSHSPNLTVGVISPL